MRSLKRTLIVSFLCLWAIMGMAQSENALHFDGVNDHVNLPTKVHDSIPGVGTIEAWIKTTNAGTSFRGIVVREFHYGIFLNNNQLMSYNWTGNGTSGAMTYTGATLNDNQWHHVALTFQTGVTSGAQLYLDGQPVGPAFTHFENVQATDFRIGTNGLVGQFFQGSIDQVKIYGRVLSPSEINDSYNCNPVNTSKLNAFYNFNQGTAGANNAGLATLTDLSGQTNNGTLFNLALNGATSNWVTGYTCQVTPCPPPFGLTTQNFCVSATVSNLSATGTSIQWYSSASGGTALTPSTPLVSGTTYYATQTVNSCESSTRLPVLVNIYPLPSAPTGSAIQTLCAGSTVSNLSATGLGIKWYTSASGGSPLSPSAGITIGNTYYASQTVNGCESADRFAVTVEACQNSLRFDGVNDFVALPQTTLGNNATIEAWIKTSDAGSAFRAIVVREFQYGLFLDNNQLMSYNWTSSGSAGPSTYTGVMLNDNQWHHVALTVQVGVENGTQMYLDGQAVGAPITLFLNATTSAFRIGCNGNTGNFFQGQIDNVKLWSRTLSPAEINASYNCSVATTTNLSGSYAFNHGQAGLTNTGVTTLSDNSGNNNNGTLNGFALTGSISNWVTGTVCTAAQCPAPFGPSVQYFCNSGTVGDLNVTGTNVQWYTAATGGSPLSLSTPLLSGMNTYYASQTVNGCESPVRYATVVYVTATPGAPTGSAQQTFCEGATIANLQATGTNIKWYNTASGGSPLATNTPLVAGTTYYASQTINTCESSNRFAVTIIGCQNALAFDGTSDYVSTSIASIGNTGTIEAWIKTSNAGTGFRGIVTREQHYGLFLNNNQLATFNWSPNGTTGATTYTGATLNDNEWHYVVLTYQVGVTNGTQMYLDGQPVGAPITLFTNTPNTNFTIGTNGTSGQFYQGQIDNVKLWTRNLSAAEILNTYNCATVSTANLVTHYTFNRGVAGQNNAGQNSLPDVSGNGNNGTLLTFALNGSTSNWVTGFDCLTQSCPTPTGSASQTFCNSGTVADLTATGTTIQWYATPTGGTALSASTPLVNGTTYYATQTTAACESSNRLAVTVTINTPAAPTGTAAQTFCNAATVANLTATGTAIQWYATPTGGAALTTGTAIANGTTYYASQTVSGCESVNRFAVTVSINSPAAPTGTAAQTFCNAATVSNLTATGSGIQWYAASTGGTALTAGTSLSNGTIYYASQTVSGCESVNRFAVTVTINAPVAPTGSAVQDFCNAATVADLTATGSGIQWYTAASGGTALAAGTALSNGTYYASQTISGCESVNRLAVSVTINTPSAPTGAAAQTICGAGTLADLTVSGSNITWYDAASSGTVLGAGTALADGVTYYASQTVNGCESVNRLAVTVTVNAIPAAPTATASQDFCNGATVADLTATGSGIEWYTSATGGTTLTSGTALSSGSYFAAQTVNGCESTDRTEVVVSITTPATPTGDAAQNFCSASTVADLTATGTAIQWYTQATGGTALTSGTALSSGTYYASQTISGCESERLAVAVTVTILNAATTVNGLTISANQSGASYTWVDCNNGNQPISGATAQTFTATANGSYAVIVEQNGCTVTSNCVEITTVGLEDIKTELFRVYPNPASTMINVEMANASTIRLFDVSGKLLKELNGSSFYTIDVTDLNRGMYMIESVEGAKAKFVKE
jgi:trimeric autotransporter adhesin